MSLRPYIYGREFLVRSDHKPLIYLYSLKNPAYKLTRIRLDLEEYNFIIVVADALSRISINDFKETDSEENKSILVTTRSMSKSKITPNKPEFEENNIKAAKVKMNFDCAIDRKIPKMRLREVKNQ